MYCAESCNGEKHHWRAAVQMETEETAKERDWGWRENTNLDVADAHWVSIGFDFPYLSAKNNTCCCCAVLQEQLFYYSVGSLLSVNSSIKQRNLLVQVSTMSDFGRAAEWKNTHFSFDSFVAKCEQTAVVCLQRIRVTNTTFCMASVACSGSWVALQILRKKWVWSSI